MLLMLLYQARATYWKYDSFKDDLIIFKINFFPPANSERSMVDWGKTRLPEWPFPGGIANCESWYSAKPAKWEGMEGQLLHKTSRGPLQSWFLVARQSRSRLLGKRRLLVHCSLNDGTSFPFLGLKLCSCIS